MTFSGFRSTFTDPVRSAVSAEAVGLTNRWGAMNANDDDQPTQEIVSDNNVGSNVLRFFGLVQNPVFSLFSGWSVDIFDTENVQHADVDLIVLWRITEATLDFGANLTFGLFGRGSGDVPDQDETFYALEFGTGGADGFQLVSVVDNIRTALASESAFDATQNEWVYAQLRIQGDQISGRHWVFGDAPPAIWQLGPITDTDITASGWVGFGTDVNLEFEVDYFAAATDGDSAQLPLVAPTPSTNQLTASPSTVKADASSLLVWVGEPNISIDWALSAGDGSLAVLTDFTDEAGKAFARYDPGTVGTKTVEVTHGT